VSPQPPAILVSLETPVDFLLWANVANKLFFFQLPLLLYYLILLSFKSIYLCTLSILMHFLLD
jgi:hypothetical protein